MRQYLLDISNNKINVGDTVIFKGLTKLQVGSVFKITAKGATIAYYTATMKLQKINRPDQNIHFLR
jgi:hypothetical protein